VRRAFLGALSLLAFLALWQALALRLGPRVLPSPLRVLLDLRECASDPAFLLHFACSLLRASAGALLGVAVAFPLGILMGSSGRLDALLSPPLLLTYPVPKVLFLPVLLVALGLGEAPKVILVALTVGYQVLVVTRDSVRNLDQGYLDSFRCVWPGVRGSGRALALARHVLVPWSLPAAVTSLRLASGTGVAVLFMAESFATQRGLGYVIMDAWGLMDLPRMFSGIVAMGLLGGLFFLLSDLAERGLCRWRLSEGPSRPF
jgi:NitT/TauT family transport system permease protein